MHSSSPLPDGRPMDTESRLGDGHVNSCDSVTQTKAAVCMPWPFDNIKYTIESIGLGGWP